MYSFQRQLWSDAINEFTKLILIDPEDADAYMFRGRSYAALSFYYDAMEVNFTDLRISRKRLELIQTILDTFFTEGVF